VSVYPLLNFSCPPPEIKNQFGHMPELWDPIRKKFISFQPEEWVRQWLIRDLELTYNYPITLMSCERGTSFNELCKRFDLLVRDRQGEPLLLVECKSYKLGLIENDIQQAFTYNATIGANNVLLTNGLSHLFFSKNIEGGWSLQDGIVGF